MQLYASKKVTGSLYKNSVDFLFEVSRAMAMKRSKLLLIFGILYLFHHPSLAQKSDENFSGYKLFQTKPKTEKDRQLLDEMDQFYPEDVVDFWRDPKEDTVEFLVHGEASEDLSTWLQQENITFRIKIDDFQRYSNSE